MHFRQITFAHVSKMDSWSRPLTGSIWNSLPCVEILKFDNPTPVYIVWSKASCNKIRHHSLYSKDSYNKICLHSLYCKEVRFLLCEYVVRMVESRIEKKDRSCQVSRWEWEGETAVSFRVETKDSRHSCLSEAGCHVTRAVFPEEISGNIVNNEEKVGRKR